MIKTDYKIDALPILLCEDCLSAGYYPLIPYKDTLTDNLKKLGCTFKSDISKLSDEELLNIGLADTALVKLFRRFLTLYDPKPQKFREIAKLTDNPDKQCAFEELYCLPGVKFVRASLYYCSGYTTIKSFMETTVEEVLSKTALAIKEQQLECIVPLPKEIRTHIAVAKAFLL